MRIEKKSREKANENRDIFEIDEVVIISNFLRINSEKMLADAQNPKISNKSIKENWKIKGKIIYKKETIAKCRSLLTNDRLLN